MGLKRTGTKIELDMVKAMFKAGGFGFRAPGSGTYIVEDDLIPYTELQDKCKIYTSARHIDLGYDPVGYLTADYAGYFPNRSLSSRVKIFGDCEENEFRFVEAKTVRLRKSHLTAEEKKVDRDGINRKSHAMIERFSILEKDNRKFVKRPDPANPKKNVKVENPYIGMMRKSDFCMELQRTWYMAELARSTNIFRCAVNGYLHVRFIGSNTELWIKVATLTDWQDSERSKKRDYACTKLCIEKNDENEISWYWY